MNAPTVGTKFGNGSTWSNDVRKVASVEECTLHNGEPVFIVKDEYNCTFMVKTGSNGEWYSVE